MALVVYDSTRWLDCFALPDKTWEWTYDAFREFLFRDLRYVWTDNSPELSRARRELGVAHGTATPYRPETNGLAERAVRRVLEGTRVVLDQAGLPPEFWSLACRH